MVLPSDLVVWLRDVDRDDAHIVGVKAAELGELIQNKFNVPNGFVIPASVYDQFIKFNKLSQPITHLLNSINPEDPNSIKQVSMHIQKLIMNAPFDDSVISHIFRAYETLIEKSSSKTVAVRASHIPKKSLGESRHDSQINVKGEASVAHALRLVWASLYEAKVLSSVTDTTKIPSTMKIGVVIQNMIHADSSGIMYTDDPVHDKKNIILIQSVLGIGEYLKNQNAVYDTYQVNRDDHKIIQKNIARQEKMMSMKNNEHALIDAPKKKQNLQKITDSQIIRLARLAEKINTFYYFPQDIEWSIEGDEIHILEVRPLRVKQDKGQSINKSSIPLNQSYRPTTLLLGEPVSPGIGIGIVRIITSDTDQKNFRPGEIYVAENTSQKNESTMRKAGAIVIEKSDRNSHAARVAREFGIPAVIGVPNARKMLKSGAIITVKGNTGEIIKGNIKHTPEHQQTEAPSTKTKVYTEIDSLNVSEKLSNSQIDGVGLLSVETLLSAYKYHPNQIMHDRQTKDFSAFLVKEIGILAKSIYPKVLFYSFGENNTQFYKGLKGGREYEMVEENFLLGFRGTHRLVQSTKFFELQLSALKSVRAFGYNNVHFLLPFVRSIKEFEIAKKYIHAHGFRRSTTFQIWISCSVPSVGFEIENYIRSGVDGVRIDSRSLSQLMTGFDKNNPETAYEINVMSESLLQLYQHVIQQCKKKKIPVIFSADSPMIPIDLVDKLVKWGVDGLSLDDTDIHKSRRLIQLAETSQ